MLRSLKINSLAIIDSLEIEFHQGLNMFTGETGAGKSILFDALNLVLGVRADLSFIAEGAQKSSVVAVFDLISLPEVRDFLEVSDLENQQDLNTCIIRRVLKKDAASSSYINDISVSLKTLNQLGDKLVDIYGQHEHQSLLSSKSYLRILDAFANNYELLANVKKVYHSFEQTKSELEDLVNSSFMLEQKRQLLQTQLDDLEVLDPKEGEWEQLLKRHNFLSNIQTIQDAGNFCMDILNKDVIAKTNLAYKKISDITEHNADLNLIAGRLNSLLLEAEDLVTDIKHNVTDFEFSQHKFVEIDQRLSLWFSIAKKYQLDKEFLHASYEKVKLELADLGNPDKNIKILKEDLEKLKTEYLALAKQLRTKRLASVDKLEQKVEVILKSLAMETAKFKITLSETNKISINGFDKCEFLIATNQGSSLGDIKKIASGGELSRISLALQLTNSDKTKTPILVFDEVDVGVGGAVSEILGQQLSRLANESQVLLITHQPQIASFADAHFKVSKKIIAVNGQSVTRSTLSHLSFSQSIEELARMLGGINLSQTALANAKNMHQEAKDFKTNIRKI